MIYSRSIQMRMILSGFELFSPPQTHHIWIESLYRAEKICVLNFYASFVVHLKIITFSVFMCFVCRAQHWVENLNKNWIHFVSLAILAFVKCGKCESIERLHILSQQTLRCAEKEFWNLLRNCFVMFTIFFVARLSRKFSLLISIQLNES